MSIWNFVRGELIDIVEWVDDTPDTMVWRFPRPDNEIKNGAKLIVRESQVAAFINEGQLADLFLFPGTFTLATQNLPVLSTLRGWKYGFDSPFKAEVYFVSTKTFTGHKWGTKNPIMLRDPEFGPVRLRAFGTFAVKVVQPATFLKEIVGTNGRFSTGDIAAQLRDMVVARFADTLGESRIPLLDLASNYDELGQFITSRIKDDFAAFGLEVVRLWVENISLPPEVEQALDKRTSMGIVGDLHKYAQFQSANAMEKAAENPGGAGASGIGMGMGFAMANQMGQMFGNAQQGQSQPQIQGHGQGSPPQLPPARAARRRCRSSRVPPSGTSLTRASRPGQLDRGALQQGARAGKLTRDTLVWRKGMGQWSKAGEVQELADLIGEVPPPLPQV
jgi:membrane protease subunit (stomatin/prohibitin family)